MSDLELGENFQSFYCSPAVSNHVITLLLVMFVKKDTNYYVMILSEVSGDGDGENMLSRGDSEHY